MEKKIITISREFGSGGRTIGHKVAERLGIPFYDKELVNQVALESGFAPKFVEEHGEHSPSSSLFSYAFAPQGVPGVMNGLSTADFLWNIQCNVILQLAEKGPCVIVGRCGNYALRSINDVTDLFICANMEDRIHRIMERYHFSEKDAINAIHSTDKRRKHYYENYTHQKWGSIDSHQMLLNVSRLGMDRTVEIIKQLYNH